MSVEVDAQPTPEHARRRRRRSKEPPWLARRQLRGDACWRRAPQRDTAVAVVIVVEVAQRSLPLHEEARLTVTHPFRDAR